MNLVREVPAVRDAALAVALFLGGLGLELGGAPGWAVIAAYAACYLAGGLSPARDGLGALRERRLDVDVLMVVAALAAAAIGQWRDGALLIVIFATSGALEELATRRTERSLRDLVTLTPETAERLDAAGVPATVPARDLVAGDRALVRPGERVPADATVLSGESEVDQAAVTGEPLPVPRRPGEAVYGGTANGAGALVVRVDRPAAESVAARVAALVQEATAAKAPTQLFIERVEQRYAVGVVAATLLLLAVPPLLLGWPFRETLLRAMTFMVVASPCAVVLSTMPALLSAVATAGRNGVLVKGGAALERLAEVDVVAFDKTGTLTEGRPEVTRVTPFQGWDAGELLALAAAAEQRSEHPLAAAVVAAAPGPAGEVEGFRALPGRGVEARVGGRAVRVGGPRLFGDLPGEVAATLAAGAAGGGTAVLVEVDGVPAGVLTVTDRLRHGAARAVRRLGQLGVGEAVLLTGDQTAAAGAVAGAVGIARVEAGLLPADKADRVRALRAAGRRVLAVGDGINDAPALAAADVSVAMGRRGSDLTLDTADIVLLSDRITRLPATVELARRARRLVRQNLALALGAIALLVGLDLAGRLPLPLAVAGHEGSTLLVALNGLRMLAPSAWPAPRACTAPRRRAALRTRSA